jgi:hypothetical protein
LGDVASFTRRLPPHLRPPFDAFWGVIREKFAGLEHEVISLNRTKDYLRGLVTQKAAIETDLRNQVASLRATVDGLVAQQQQPKSESSSPLARLAAKTPSLCSEYRNVQMGLHNEMLQAMFGGDTLTSEVLEQVIDLDPSWVKELLIRRRDKGTEDAALPRYRCSDGGVGCWMSATQPNRPGGYVKVNLSNTFHPDGSGNKIGVSVYQHQLSVVARGNGAMLRLAGKGGRWDVSHLCHNSLCFNPDHVRVEPKWLNSLRKVCAGLQRILLPDGSVIHPCRHAKWGVPCLLPTWEKPVGHGFWYLADDGPENEPEMMDVD